MPYQRLLDSGQLSTASERRLRKQYESLSVVELRRDTERLRSELFDLVEGKVEDVQSKRKADDLLDDLGRFSFAERTGRPVSGADAEIDRIVGELTRLEAEGVKILPDA